MGKKQPNKLGCTPLATAKCPKQSASGVAFVGVATALQSISGLQYIIFAADMETLHAAWADAGGGLLEASMVKPVTIFERPKTPNV